MRRDCVATVGSAFCNALPTGNAFFVLWGGFCMGFRVGFHKTLFKLGKWRFGIGYGLHGTKGLIMLLVFAMLNLMWYMLLLALWIYYGIFWLFILCPIKFIIKLFRKRKATNCDEGIDDLAKSEIKEN